jgi:hypothetical protein
MAMAWSDGDRPVERWWRKREKIQKVREGLAEIFDQEELGLAFVARPSEAWEVRETLVDAHHTR